MIVPLARAWSKYFNGSPRKILHIIQLSRERCSIINPAALNSSIPIVTCCTFPVIESSDKSIRNSADLGTHRRREEERERERGAGQERRTVIDFTALNYSAAETRALRDSFSCRRRSVDLRNSRSSMRIIMHHAARGASRDKQNGSGLCRASSTRFGGIRYPRWIRDPTTKCRAM